jgi:hypothetical protein
MRVFASNVARESDSGTERASRLRTRSRVEVRFEIAASVRMHVGERRVS